MSLETAFSAGTPIAASKMPIPGVGDLPAFAKNNPVLCFDNLSTIGAPTGINDVATRGDLTDRTIVVRLEKIPEAERRTDAEVREAFALAHSRILAALLDMVTMGLRRYEDVRRERRRLPRMADFALWGFAVAPALGWSAEDFDRAYRANRNEAFEAAIEDDPIAPHILGLLQGRPEKSWLGTTEQLWTRINRGRGGARDELSPVVCGARESPSPNRTRAGGSGRDHGAGARHRGHADQPASEG